MPAIWERAAVVLVLLAVPILVALAPTIYQAYLAPEEPPPRFTPRSAVPTLPDPVQQLLQAWRQPQPELVLAFSGQMYGYLQPCGCARPQVGGLERRLELVQRLRQAGWPIVGFDLGDLARLRHEIKQGVPALADQSRLKYETAWKILKECGWQAVGIGPEEILFPLEDVFGWALNSRPPVLVGSNLDWPDWRDTGAYRPWVLCEVPVVARAGSATTGRLEQSAPPPAPVSPPLTPESTAVWRIACLAVISDSVVSQLRKELPQNAEIFKRLLPAEQALAQLWPEIEKSQPHLLVLLHHGSEEEARQLAQRFGEIDLVLNRDVADVASSMARPLPTSDARTLRRPFAISNRLLLSVGHKGKAIGLVGVRPAAQVADAAPATLQRLSRAVTYRLDYRMVELIESLELPPDRTNPVREAMREYVYQVYARDFLRQWVEQRQVSHPQQLDQPGSVFVGSERCAECHRSACRVWGQSKHSQAYAALVKYGEPKTTDQRSGQTIGRQYDPECVICHTTGFEYRSGFRNERDTPQLVANGCENCHGPASLHVQFPNEPKYWQPLRRNVGNIVNTCRACHDSENDPHFDFSKYWPQIVHKKD